VKLPAPKTAKIRRVRKSPRQTRKGKPRTDREHAITSTTSFLTATTLIYAVGAGITAAAGHDLFFYRFLPGTFKRQNYFIRFCADELAFPLTSVFPPSCLTLQGLS